MPHQDLLFRPRLPDALAEEVKAQARRSGLSSNEFVVRILDRALARPNDVRPGALSSFPQGQPEKRQLSLEGQLPLSAKAQSRYE